MNDGVLLLGKLYLPRNEISREIKGNIGKHKQQSLLEAKDVIIQ